MRNLYSCFNFQLVKYIMIWVLLCGATQSYAQFYHIIGNGTQTSNVPNTTPFSTDYEDGRHMYLLRSSELSGSNYNAPINSVGWKMTSVSSLPVNGITIKISTTTGNYLPSTFPTNATTVYTSNSPYQVTIGWNQFTFNTPYTWNGVDNLIVEVCFDNNTSQTGSNYVECSIATGFADGAFANGATGCSLTGTGGSYFRPNIRLGYQILGNDVGISDLVAPNFPTCSLDSTLAVSIKNFGSDTLTSATIHWTLNGITQPTYSYTNTTGLMLNQEDTVTLGNIAGGLQNGDVLEVWTSLPNGIVDSMTNNDTLSMTLMNSLNGIYTIDPSGNGDILSFGDAVQALNLYGVCGPTTFEALNGTYVENMELDSYAGMDSINTVTFRSQSGNRDMVVLQFAGTNVSDNYVVRLYDADNFLFKDMTLENLGTSYAQVFDIWGSDRIVIDNCVLKSSVSVFSWDANNIQIHHTSQTPSQQSNHFTLNNCELVGGYHGLYVYNNVNATHYQITNNRFIEPYYKGTHIRHVDSLTFENNYVNSNSLEQYGYGFYLVYIKGGSVINNHVEGTITWPQKGMYARYCEGGLNDRFPFHNNRMSLLSGNAHYGMDVSNGLFLDFSHNSIYIGAPTNSAGMYMSYGGFNTVFNNTIEVLGTNARGVYAGGNGTIYQMDHNNICAPNGFIGWYSGFTYNTLSAWQSGTGFDSNSINICGAFQNTSTLEVCHDSLYAAGLLLLDITHDFDGDPRQTPPCIGADEFMPTAQFSIGEQYFCVGDTLVMNQPYFDLVVWNQTDTGETYLITQPGNYSVTVTGNCGIDSANFTVYHAPQVSIADVNLCEGDVAVIQGGISNGTYLWNNGSTDSLITVDSAQVVIVEVTDSYGCYSNDTAYITQSYDVDLPDSTFFCEGDSLILDANVPGSYNWNTGSSDQAITVSDSGYYSVTVSDQNCVSTDGVWVTEQFYPIASFDDSASFLTMVFTNTSQHADSFYWSFGNGTFSNQEHPIHVFPWMSGGCYDVTLEAYNQCGVDSTKKIYAVDTYIFDPYISHSPNNNSVLFQVYSFYNPQSFLWDFGDGMTSNVASPTHVYNISTSQSFNVSVVVETDCGSVTLEKQIWVNSLGVDEMETNHGISVFPNPNSGNFNLTMDLTQSEEVEVNVFDVVGNQVHQRQMGVVSGNVDHEITIANNAKGVYFVMIRIGNQEYVERVVVR